MWNFSDIIWPLLSPCKAVNGLFFPICAFYCFFPNSLKNFQNERLEVALKMQNIISNHWILMNWLVFYKMLPCDSLTLLPKLSHLNVSLKGLLTLIGEERAYCFAIKKLQILLHFFLFEGIPLSSWCLDHLIVTLPWPSIELEIRAIQW